MDSLNGRRSTVANTDDGYIYLTQVLIILLFTAEVHFSSIQPANATGHCRQLPAKTPSAALCG
jgi:hypothetical protein